MIIIGVNPATSKINEGEDAVVDVEVLFGSLDREVSVMLSTLDDGAQGLYIVHDTILYYACMRLHDIGLLCRA